MIRIQKNSHNGVDYIKIESSNDIEGALGIGTEKFVIKGIPAIELMKNSYAYGDEVQVTVYTKAGLGVKTERVKYAKEYDRIEMFFKKTEFLGMCKRYIELIELEGGEKIMGELQKIVQKRSPYLNLEAGQSVEALYKGYKLVPSQFDHEKEVFRFMLEIGGETKYWDTGSNRVALVFDTCVEGDLVTITKSLVEKNGKDSVSWEVKKVGEENDTEPTKK